MVLFTHPRTDAAGLRYFYAIIPHESTDEYERQVGVYQQAVGVDSWTVKAEVRHGLEWTERTIGEGVTRVTAKRLADEWFAANPA